MIKTTIVHDPDPVLDDIKIKEDDPYERARKSVELIHTIDNISKLHVLELDKRVNQNIPLLTRNKKYKADFNLYTVYASAKKCYKHFSEKKKKGTYSNDAYINCCFNVSHVLKNFYEKYCAEIYKKLKIPIEKNKNLIEPFTLIVNKLYDIYDRYPLLISQYAKIEAIDEVCNLLLIILRMVKFATVERILAEINYNEAHNLSYYTIMAEILFSYTAIDIYGKQIKNVVTSYNFLHALVYNEYTGLSSTLLKALELEASIMNSFCNKYHELIMHINQTTRDYVRKNIKSKIHL